MSKHNVQCRIVGDKNWTDHGSVTILDAMIAHVRPRNAIDSSINVEARWEHEPHRVWLRPVRSFVQCRVMNPRGGAK